MPHEKSNPNASSGKPPVIFGAEAHYFGGAALTPDGGGIVFYEGQTYSVAAAEMVPADQRAEARADGSTAIPANRVGRVALLTHDQQLPTTYGAEQESAQLRADGSYAKLPTDYLLKASELYTFMREAGTKPTDDPAEFERRFWGMIHGEVDAAAKVGEYVAALSVFGQYEPDASQINPSPYVRHVGRAMTARTGFQAFTMFRTAGMQGHTGGSNTMAALQAMEAMQYLSPILAAPTLAAPLVHGGIAGNLAGAAFTEQQLAHLRRTGVSREDLTGPYQSWRYLLRLLGSPSAGIWKEPPADSPDALLEQAHGRLANRDINNIDRNHGWHADRLRVVLDGSGANTFEDCSADTGLGNPKLMVPLHLHRSALFTTFEKMAMQERDPRLAVASMLGTATLSRRERLWVARNIMLREVSRYGTDATTYRGRLPGEWLPELLHIAEQAPYTKLTDNQTDRLRRSYATWEETAPEIDRWCTAHGTNTPNAQTWFDLGVNNPAVYLQAQYRELRKQGHARQDAIRQVELDAGKALHAASQRIREAA